MDQATRREPNMESQGYLGNSRVILNHFDAATQADIQHIALSYDSEDETMHRRSRRLPSTPYSKHDIREQYCISERGLGVLERGGGATGGLFGCLAGSAPNATSPCAAAARGSLLTVCVRRRVPSDENISELCMRRPEDYAPMPRYPRYPWPSPPADLYRYDSDLACSYFRRRPRSLCGASDPSRFTWLPADEEGGRLEGPRSVRSAEREFRHSSETLHWQPGPGGVCLVHPVPVLPSAMVQHGDGSVHRPKHVSFARSHTLTSFDDAVVSIGGGCSGGARLARSQERLLDGRKTADPPPITRQPELSDPPRLIIEKLKRLPMKTQATQTEVCLGRKPVPSAQLTLSPRTIHRVKMVSQGAQTNGMILGNGRKLMKSYSEAGGKFTYEECDQMDHEPLQRTQSEEPPRSPFIVNTPSPEPEDNEDQQPEEIVSERFATQTPLPQTQIPVHTQLVQSFTQAIPPTTSQPFAQPFSPPISQPFSPPISQPFSPPISQPFSPPISQPFLKRVQPLVHSPPEKFTPVVPERCHEPYSNIDNQIPDQVLPTSQHQKLPPKPREEPKSDHESEDSETKNQEEIIIDFEPQIPSSPLKRKPLLKTASDGEILLDKRRAQRQIDEDNYLPKNITSLSHDNITLEPEEHSFVPYFQNSPIRHEDIFKDLNNAHLIFSSVETDHETQSFRAQDSLDEEFHENLIYGGLFRKQSSSSEPEGKTSRNDSNSPSAEEDGVVPTLHLLPEQKISPFASSDSLANDMRDHSDGIWNESQATVLQADSGTENGTGLSASELSSTLSTHSPGAITLLTPSSRRKHLLLLQHQQRSSMDTDALDEESQGEGQILTPTQPPRPVSPKILLPTAPHSSTLAPPSTRFHPSSPRSSKRRSSNTSHLSESSLDLRSLETRSLDTKSLDARSFEARSLESRSLEHQSLRSLCNGAERAAVVPDLLLARTDSGRTNTDISESTTTDDYMTATSGTDSSRRSIESREKDRERHHAHPSQDGSSFESASSIYPLSEDMVVPSFSPPILEEASDAALTPVPPLPASRSRSRSASSSSSGSYSLNGACRDPEPVTPRHVASVSDEEGGRYSSSGYYESPLEDDSTNKTRGNVDGREWTDEEKRRKKRAFTLEISKHQNTEDQIQKPSTSEKLKSPHSQRDKDNEAFVQGSPRTISTEKPLKRTKVRNRSPMQGRRISGSHANKRSPTQAHTPEVAEDVHATGAGGTSDESSSGVCGDVQLQVQNQNSPRKIRKIREGNRRKSTPRSPTSSRGKRRNGSGDDKPSSLPGSLPRRRNKHEANDDNHSNTLPATKSSRLSPYKSPSGSPKRRSSKTSPEVRLKALSAESLRSVSPGSDSVFYSDPSSHAPAPPTEHQVHCLHCGKEVDIVTTDDPDKSNASSNGREPDIVQPPAGFADSPRLKHGRLYKKLEKRFRSEERSHAERRHHKYKGDVRAKSEERCMRSESTPPPVAPRPRSASGGPTHLRSGSGSFMLASPGGDLPHLHAHGGDEDTGTYTEPYRAAQWVYIGEGEEQVAWKKSDSSLHQGSGSGAGGSSSPEVSRRDSLESITSTESEHEFKKKYQAITHRMVHRKSCLEMYKRQASKSFESDKTIIVRRESGEFGFRIHGSKPVVVSAIEPDTPAESSGLEVGDIVLAVNGVSVLDKSHSEVVKIAHAGSDTLTLEVARTCGVLSPTTPETQENTALYSGYLWKQGGHVSGTPTNKWIRRWFCVKKDNCLYSYKTDLDQQPVGAMMLTHYQVSLLPDVSDSRPHRLCLSRIHSNHKSSHTNSSPTDSPPPLYLAADNDSAAQRWTSILSGAVERSKVADQWLETTRRNLGIPPSQVQKPDCFGYLNKLGSKWKTWNRKYCVLKDACMYFYQDANAKYSYGMACLQGYRVQQSTTGGKKHAFEILPSDNSQKHFYFHTESDMDRKRWVAALEYSIDRWLKVG